MRYPKYIFNCLSHVFELMYIGFSKALKDSADIDCRMR